VSTSATPRAAEQRFRSVCGIAICSRSGASRTRTGDPWGAISRRRSAPSLANGRHRPLLRGSRARTSPPSSRLLDQNLTTRTVLWPLWPTPLSRRPAPSRRLHLAARDTSPGSQTTNSSRPSASSPVIGKRFRLASRTAVPTMRVMSAAPGCGCVVLLGAGPRRNEATWRARVAATALRTGARLPLLSAVPGRAGAPPRGYWTDR
jgi:hypothetical protein